MILILGFIIGFVGGFVAMRIYRHFASKPALAVTQRPKSACLWPRGCDCADCVEKYGPIRPDLVGMNLITRRHARI